MSEQKTKHIPGPWVVEHPYGEGGIYVSQTNTALIAKVYYGQEANARLIAAAPELENACRLLVDAIAQITDTCQTFEQRAAMEAGRTALEKAGVL